MEISTQKILPVVGNLSFTLHLQSNANLSYLVRIQFRINHRLRFLVHHRPSSTRLSLLPLHLRLCRLSRLSRLGRRSLLSWSHQRVQLCICQSQLGQHQLKQFEYRI